MAQRIIFGTTLLSRTAAMLSCRTGNASVWEQQQGPRPSKLDSNLRSAKDLGFFSRYRLWQLPALTDVPQPSAIHVAEDRLLLDLFVFDAQERESFIVSSQVGFLFARHFLQFCMAVFIPREHACRRQNNTKKAFWE